MKFNNLAVEGKKNNRICLETNIKELKNSTKSKEELKDFIKDNSNTFIFIKNKSI